MILTSSTTDPALIKLIKEVNALQSLQEAKALVSKASAHTLGALVSAIGVKTGTNKNKAAQVGLVLHARFSDLVPDAMPAMVSCWSLQPRSSQRLCPLHWSPAER